MANYTPTDQFDFNNIPLTGVLVPGATVGYIAESKFIKGGYIVVKTITERDALLDKSFYEDKEITIGTPVFVSDENKTYRYMGENSGPDLWLEDTADLQQVTEDISSLQQIILDQKTEIDGKVSQEEFISFQNDVNNTVINLNKDIQSIGNNCISSLESLKTQVDENTEKLHQKIDGEMFFTALTNINDELNKKANLTEVQNIVNNIKDINNDIIWDSDEPTKYALGGLVADSILKGLSVKEILMMILYGYSIEKPEYNPTNKLPTATIISNNVVGISSNPIQITGTIIFDRGEITLNGEHQNWMAGKVYSITFVHPITGEKVETPITTPDDGRIEEIPFEYNLNSLPLNEVEMLIEVNYSEGAQPIDNFGNPIDHPIPAGSIKSSIKLIGLTNTWTGNESNINDVVMQQIDQYIIKDDSVASIDKSGMFQEINKEGDIIGAGYQVELPAWTSSSDYSTLYSPIILIASGQKIVGVKVWDACQGSWQWYQGEKAEDTVDLWIPMGTTEKSYNNQTIEYTIYKLPVSTVFGIPLHFRFYVSLQEENNQQ